MELFVKLLGYSGLVYFVIFFRTVHPFPSIGFGNSSKDNGICSKIEVFLVSDIPRKLLLDHPYAFTAINNEMEGKNVQNIVRRGDIHLRAVVIDGKVTKLWSNGDGVVAKSDESGGGIIFKIVAPITSFIDSLMAGSLNSIVRVEVQAKEGLDVTFKVSGAEGGGVRHSHSDVDHRPIADLDIQYRMCDAPVADNPIMVSALVYLTHCEPLKFSWSVLCSHFLVAHHPEPPIGFNIGKSFKVGETGDIVSNGVVSPQWGSLEKAEMYASSKDSTSVFFLWCHMCNNKFPNSVHLKLPSIAVDDELLTATVMMSKKAVDGGENDPLPFFIFFGNDIGGSSEIFSLRNEDPPLRLEVSYFCKKEGVSMVMMEIVFNKYKPLNLVWRKQCNEGVPKLRSFHIDSLCRDGFPNPKRTVCCASSCFKCHDDPCTADADPKCCEKSIISTKSNCSKLLTYSPCVLQTSSSVESKLEKASVVETSHVNVFSFFLWCLFVSLLLLLLIAVTSRNGKGQRGSRLLPRFSDFVSAAITLWSALKRAFGSVLMTISYLRRKVFYYKSNVRSDYSNKVLNRKTNRTTEIDENYDFDGPANGFEDDEHIRGVRLQNRLSYPKIRYEDNVPFGSL